MTVIRCRWGKALLRQRFTDGVEVKRYFKAKRHMKYAAARCPEHGHSFIPSMTLAPTAMARPSGHGALIA